MPNVTIGCPTYSGASGVRKLFASISGITQYAGEVEAIVVDDGSPPTQAEEIAVTADWYGLTLLRHESNQGIPSSWNSLVKAAKHDYIVLINDDVEVVDPYWLECLIGFIRENRKRGTKIGPVGLPTEPAMMPRMCYPISGWCMGFHREVVEATHGFWEKLTRYYEDSTFFIEAAKRGFFPVQLGGPCMLHEESKTLSEHAWMRETNIPEAVRLEILASSKTKGRYSDYCSAAGDAARDYESWVDEILAINPRSSLSRYMFCKRYGLKDMLEHYHEETVQKYIDPLRRAWSECDLVWFESNGEEVIRRGE
jgi:glycosyltransferase involved in cell wall biosynthesis